MAGEQKPTKPRKRAAARAEVSNAPRTLTWRDETFDLPAEVPLVTSLKFRRLARTERIDHAADVIESVIGERQMLQVEGVLADCPDDELSKELSELLTAIFDEYGMTEGESTASPSS